MSSPESEVPTATTAAPDSPGSDAPLAAVQPVDTALELGYAPPAKDQRRAIWVIVAGLATTALALAGQFGAAIAWKTNIMGFYLYFVIPAGAIFIGLLASSGYAIMSWTLGVKVRRGLLVAIMSLLVLSYFAAQYVEFRATGPYYVLVEGSTPAKPKVRFIGFWERFHLQAVNWAWKKDTSRPRVSASSRGPQVDEDDVGEPLGLWGYAFVSLGLIGFAGGGLILPVVVGATAYCELCERYMSTKDLATIPASVPGRKISKRQVADLEAYEQQKDAARREGGEIVDRLGALAAASDAEGFNAVIAALPMTTKKANKLPARIQIKLVHCATCAQGKLQQFIVVGQGKQLRSNMVGESELAPAFVRAIRSR